MILAQQFISVFILVLGLSYLFSSKAWIAYARQLIDGTVQTLPLALLLLSIGTVLVLTHNRWVMGTELIVTVFAWLIFIKAVALLVFPGIVKMYKNMPDNVIRSMLFMSGIVLTSLGAILVWMYIF